MRALLLFLIALLPSVAHAAAYPWVDAQDDLRLVADARMELALRLAMIRQARHRVDVVIYEQGDDDAVGMPVLSALRDAANRGVKVRIITGWFFQSVRHPFNVSPTFTTNPPAAVPIEYVVFGSPQSVLRNGWEPSDGVHGKLTLVDGQWALVTGRSHAEGGLRWVDSAFILKGALAEQSQQAFDELWVGAKATSDLYEPAFRRDQPSGRQVQPHLPTARTRLSAVETEELNRMLAWLHRASPAPKEGGTRARLLHFNFVTQMKALTDAGKTPRTWDERLATLHDPVTDAVIERLNQAGAGSEVRFTAMYAILHPALRKAVLEARQRGAKVIMFTNDKFVAPPITTAAWLAGIQDTAALVDAGVQVHTFQRGFGGKWDFMHLKLVIIDDVSFFGSHNMNLPSSIANDEINYEVEDKRLAAQLRELFDSYVQDHGSPVSRQSAAVERPLGPLARWLLDPVLGFY